MGTTRIHVGVRTWIDNGINQLVEAEVSDEDKAVFEKAKQVAAHASASICRDHMYRLTGRTYLLP